MPGFVILVVALACVVPVMVVFAVFSTRRSRRSASSSTSPSKEELEAEVTAVEVEVEVEEEEEEPEAVVEDDALSLPTSAPSSELAAVPVSGSFGLEPRALTWSFADPNYVSSTLLKRTSLIPVRATSASLSFEGLWAHSRNRSTAVCLKIFVDPTKPSAASASEVAQALREADALLRVVKHPHVVHALGITELSAGKTLLTELPSTDVERHIDSGQYLDPREALRWTARVCDALVYLDHKHITHGAVRPANVFLFDRGGGALIPKLGEFFSPLLSSDSDAPPYMWSSPEVLSGSPATLAGDVYSFASTVCTMIYRKKPYSEVGLPAAQKLYLVLADNLRPNVPDKCPTDLRRLFDAAWHTSPSERPAFAEYLRVLTFLEEHYDDKHDQLTPSSEFEKAVVEEIAATESDSEDEDVFEDSIEGVVEPAPAAKPATIGEEALEISDVVGSGATAWVHRGVWNNSMDSDGMPVAVKVLMKSPTPRSLEAFHHEAALLHKLRHPNIVKMHGMTTISNKPAIVTELANKGSLRNRLHDESLPSDPAELLAWATGIAKGLKHLAERGVCHLDIKPGNILLFGDNGGDDDEDAFAVPKIADFGSASMLDDTSLSATDVGTVRYMAPEMIQPGQRVCPKTDVYSFGLMLLELVTREIPFKDMNLGATVLSIAGGRRPTLPDNLHPGLRSLIERTWQQERSQRPSMAEVVAELELMDASVFALTS